MPRRWRSVSKSSSRSKRSRSSRAASPSTLTSSRLSSQAVAWHAAQQVREYTVAVRILVDSTADMPPERAGELGITVVPLTVLFGEESFRDGVDLDGRAFYERLAHS